MNLASSLKSLLVSKTRLKLLQVFGVQPGKMFYIRDLTRKINEEINSVRRELLNLKATGILESERRANKLFFWMNKKHPFYGDILSLINKTSGLGAKIINDRQRLGTIKFVIFSGKFVRRAKTTADDVDVLIIGSVILPEIGALIREEETKIGREINYTVMEANEFSFRKKNKDPFLTKILGESRVMIFGDEQEMVES